MAGSGYCNTFALCTEKVAVDDTDMNNYGCISITLYLQK